MRWLLVALITAGCVSTGPSGTFAVRLRPGDDLRASLERITGDRNVRAGYVVTCAGSLTRAAIRFADAETVSIVEGPLEIVSLTGTLSADGPHLHIVVADSAGRTIGGHLGEGSIVRTTAEIVIGEIAGAEFRREIDPATTYPELVIR